MSANNSNASPFRIFDNPEFGSIRTVVIDGKPWFVGNDVALALGYSRPYDAISYHVDKSHRQVMQMSDLQPYLKNPLADNMKGVNITLIDEAGVYDLVLGSKKPSAVNFKKWVTSDILPSIRETGSYSIGSDSIQHWRVLDAQSEFIFNNTKRVKELFSLDDVNTAYVAHKIAEEVGVPSNMLGIPEYFESKGVKNSATWLLKQFGYGISANAFNILMKEHGMITQKYRASTKTPDKQVPYWFIINEGLKYGTNETNIKNRNESQPRYYEDKFEELMGILGVQKIQKEDKK